MESAIDAKAIRFVKKAAPRYLKKVGSDGDDLERVLLARVARHASQALRPTRLRLVSAAS